MKLTAQGIMDISYIASIIIQNKMPRVEQNSMPTSLHYALTDSQCSICGGQLEWQADFNNINQPKYISQHCNQEYAIRIDTVKVEILEKASKDKMQGHEQEGNNRMSAKETDKPRALQMAEAMKKDNNSSNKKQGKSELELYPVMLNSTSGT